MTVDWRRDCASLLDAASPAVLTTYRQDGSAVASPVWYRFQDDAFEVVIAEGDVKLRHLAQRPKCSLLVFEAVPPFRGVRVEGEPQLHAGDMTHARRSIAARYLGESAGHRFAEQRRTDGVLLRLLAETARAWDLSAILPDP